MASFKPVDMRFVVEFSAEDRARLDEVIGKLNKLIDHLEVVEVPKDEATDLAQRIRDWPVKYEDTVAKHPDDEAGLEYVDPYGDTP